MAIKEPGLRGSLKHLFIRKYEQKIAVDHIDFTIHEGEFIGFIGPNGAGKTTTIKMLSGIIHPSEGSIKVMGYVPHQLQNAFKKNFSITMGQKNQLWWDIPAIDSFQLIKEIYEIPDADYKRNLQELTELLEVTHILNTPLRNLSLGERMKFELIGALLHGPKVLFLDEPTIGLDVSSRRRIREFLKYINIERKVTVILTSHYLEDIEELCNRIIAISQGRIVYDGELNRIGKEFFTHKYVAFGFDDVSALESLERYGKIIEKSGSNAKMRVDKTELNELGKVIFSRDDFYDMTIEEVPLDDIFESLFNH